MNLPGPELLGILLDRHAAALVLYARQWCVTPEDVVQEAFVKFAGQRTVPTNPTAWLYKTVRNAAITAARSAARRRKHEAAAREYTPVWFDESKECDFDPQEATTALQYLPLEQREVIVAHLWGGLTFEEIGELMDCSSSSAHRNYAAGLMELRERLGVPCPTKIAMRE